MKDEKIRNILYLCTHKRKNDEKKYRHIRVG